MKKLRIFLFSALFLASCIKINLYEKHAVIPSQEWFYNDNPKFTFHIDDTTAQYNVYIVLRHSDLYQYNNIWLRLGMKSPKDSITYQNINLILGTDKKGWEGSGMDDIYEVRKNLFTTPLSFKNSGDYTFTISQIMRENPLKYILSVGIRVEKVSM